MIQDTLGDRMKAFENVESERRGEIGMPICARLGGRAFHTFTENLPGPFDHRLTDLMIWTTSYLVAETQAVLGYTQSDEISLMWYLPEGSNSQYLFGGRFQKIASVCAAMATGFFVHHLDQGQIPEKEGQIPEFDCRAWSVPTLQDGYETFLWREKDAVKNAITMAALEYFDHKDLQGVNGMTKKAMLQEIGHPFETMPAQFRRGTYVRRVKKLERLSEEEMKDIPVQYRPTEPVERSVICPVDIPEIGHPDRKNDP